MTSDRKCKILLADDHDIVRAGLRALLEPRGDIEICGEAVTGREAVKLVEKHEPDIIIIDISMPELNGLDAVRQIVKVAPDTEILVLTMHDSEELIRDVLQAGARGYLLKSEVTQHLLDAVDKLRVHKPFLSAEVNDVVLSGFLGEKKLKGESDGQLTPREREIVQLLAEGNSNKEVANMLHISVKTAETHRTNVMRKLDLHSISDLVRYAVRNHMIEP